MAKEIDLFNLLELGSKHVYTVSELTQEIKNNLETKFNNIWVEGEISNLKLPSSGHIYFTLKDESCQIKGVMFRYRNRMLRFELKDGMQVLAFGAVTVYGPKGEYQITCEEIEPRGVGALQFAFQQLKEKLAREGLFDSAHKRKTPVLPRKIGVITSPTGAAIRDIIKVIGKRFSNVHILLYPVRVQGEEAPGDIVEAIEAMNKFTDIDVLIIGRGGGSLEDLWAFNDERVARAIFASRIPTISAVGHEIDFTIADFVADLRAPTPSAAAEMVIRDRDELQQHISSLQNRIINSFKYKISIVKRKAEKASSHKIIADPRRMFDELGQKIDDFMVRLGDVIESTIKDRRGEMTELKNSLLFLNPLDKIKKYTYELHGLKDRLKTYIVINMESKRGQFKEFVGKLESLSPLAVLQRGYSICRRAKDGNIVFDAATLKSSEKVLVKVFKGSFEASVNKITPD